MPMIMPRSKRWIASAGLVLVFAFAAHSQSPSPSSGHATPTGEQIIDRYVEAIGGRAVWQGIHSRTSLGNIEIPTVHISGTVMIHEKAPNRVLQVVILEGAVFRQGFDGQVAWSDDPQDGVKTKSGRRAFRSGARRGILSPHQYEKAKFQTRCQRARRNRRADGLRG